MIQVSIIIPHFNRSDLIAETIASVEVQTYTQWEIIVVDDGSYADELAAVQLLRTERVKVVRRIQGVKGPSTCRNLGVKLAKGEYLIFLDSDDLLASFCLEQRVKEMLKNANCDMVVFKMEEFDREPGDLKKIFNRDISQGDWSGAFISNENPWNVTCPIWKKDFFVSVGGFDEGLLYMEDPEIHLRAINSPGAVIKTFYQLPADSYYRIHHTDETKKDFNYNSIYYRLVFYKKILIHIKHSILAPSNIPYFKMGIYSLVRTFLFSRVKEFPELASGLLLLMKESGFFSFIEIQRLRILLGIGSMENQFALRLRLKGICFKLLP